MSGERQPRFRRRRIWKYSRLDALLVAVGLAQPILAVSLARSWATLGRVEAIAFAGLFAALATYNVIVVGHLFTHTRWFRSSALNNLFSMVCSFNIGQSAEAYRSHHVFNHHRYNNDRADADGNTLDVSSSFRGRRDGQHQSVGRYAFAGALDTLFGSLRAALAVPRLWRVGRHERLLLNVSSAAALAQIRRDRCFQCLAICALAVLSWEWVAFCYVPAWYLSLVLVNVQNYYEHFGALPESKHANSVSYYGRLYNLLSFNDGYHQEHHLRPGVHWRRLPSVRAEIRAEERRVSPVPAVLGFLDLERRRLD